MSTLFSDQSRQDVLAPPLPIFVTVPREPQSNLLSDLRCSDSILFQCMDSSSHENCLSFHLSKMIATQDTHPLHFPISHAQCLAIRVPSLIISPTAFTVAAVTQASQSHRSLYSLIRQQGTSTDLPVQVPSVPPPSNVASSPADSLHTQLDHQPYPSHHAHGGSSNSDLPQQFSYHPSSGIFAGGSSGAPPNHDDPSVHASLQPGYSPPPDASGYGASAHTSPQFGYSSSLHLA